MSDDINVKIKATTENVDNAAAQIKALGEGASSIIENFKGIGEALAAAFAVDKISEFARSMSELGEGIERTAKMTGLSTDDVQKFQFAVKMTGGDAETAAMSLVRLERNIADAAAGSKDAQASFAAAGVSAKTLASGNINAILGQIATKFHDTADGANKVALALEIGGRGFASMIPYLDEGQAGMERLNKEFEETNSKIPDSFAKTAAAIKLMDAATQGVSVTIMDRLNPGIVAAVTGITQMKEGFSNSITEGSALDITIKALGDGLFLIVGAVELIVASFKTLWDVGEAVFVGLNHVATGLFKALGDLLEFDVTKAFHDFAEESGKATDRIVKGIKDAAGEATTFTADIQKMIDAMNKAESSGKGLGGMFGALYDANKPQPKVPPKGGEDTKDDAETQRSLLNEKYDAEKEAATELVQLGDWTNQQKFSDLQSALAKTKAAVDQSFADQMSEYDTDDAEYQKLQDQKAIADEKFNIESMQLNDQAAKAASASWTTSLNTINATFDKMLTGVLQGTQTISQAFARMAGDMIISFMEAIAKMLIQQAALFAATQAGAKQTAEAISGASGGANAGGVSGQLITELLSLIGITTTQTALQTANTTALATLTAAVTANTVAQGGGAASFDSLVAFDTGTSFVPDDMVANMHKGEIVIPAGPSQQLRDGTASIGGGGTSIHFNVSAMDAKSVKQFFNQHGATIAKTLSSQIRGGNRSLLAHV